MHGDRTATDRKLLTVAVLDHLNFCFFLFHALMAPIRYMKITVCLMNSTRFHGLELAYSLCKNLREAPRVQDNIGS